MRKHYIGALLATLSLLTTSNQATAQTDDRDWYGEQILIADASALALGIGGYAVDDSNDDWIWPATATMLWAFTGPVVHFAHGNIGRGSASLVTRLLATGIGVHMTGDRDGPVPFVAMVVLTMVLDVGLLAFDDRDDARSDEARMFRVGFSL